MDTFAKINKIFSKYMFVFATLGLIAGAVVDFSQMSNLKVISMILFGYMTFISSLGTSFKKFFYTLTHPIKAIYILALVHIGAPIVAYFLGIIFFPDDEFMRLGFLIGASIPVGISSLIWVSIVKCNMPLALVVVTLDTFITPIIIPAFLIFIAGQMVEIEFLPIMRDLMFMVTIPSILGMLIYDYSKGSVAKFADSFGGATSKFCLVVVIAINSTLVIPQITWDASVIRFLAATFLVVFSAYVLGYFASFAIKDRTREDVLTMIYTVSIRNNVCGLVIALTYFPPIVGIPITLHILFQQPVASIVSGLIRHLKLPLSEEEYLKSKN